MQKNNADFINYEYLADGLQLNLLSGKAPEVPEITETDTFNNFHTHFWYELFFAKNEPITFHLKEKDVLVPAGHFLLVHPTHLHYVTNPESTPVFAFSVTATSSEYSAHPILENLKYPNSRIFKSDSACDMLFTLISNACLSQNAREAGNYMFGFLLHISNLQSVASEIAPPDSDISRIFKIDLLINEYVSKNKHTSLNDLAKELNISTRQLARIFNNKYGCSFTQKITRLRMEKALRYLKKGENISDVAQKTGYSSTKGFYSAFTSTYGVTPGEYKKNNSNKKHLS